MLNVRLLQGTQFLRADPSGTLDRTATHEALCTLLAEGTSGAGDAPGDYDLLFDVREADIDMTLRQVWSLMQDVEACDPGFDHRLALLGRWDRTYNRLEFLQESAQMCGIEAKAFRDFEHAVEWLWSPQARRLSALNRQPQNGPSTNGPSTNGLLSDEPSSDEPR
jgi:hypothetical protein